MQFTESHLHIEDHEFYLRYAEAFPVDGDPAYWASVWPSALALSQHLLAGESLEGKQVLEIGCGCGLAGIAAGHQEAEVTVTDVEPKALALAEENWQLNHLAPARVTPLDWCNPDLDMQFDVILAADILYHPKDFPELVRSVHTLLAPQGTLILSEPGRPHAHEFFARMLHKGYTIDPHHYPVDLHGESFEIGVSEIF